MKRTTRLVSIKNTPMVIFDAPECISDDIVKHNDFWEYALFHRWYQHFPKTGLMLDIGANIGSHCLQFKTNFPELEIWAFEPFLENYNVLIQNTKRYDDIKCFNVGVGSNTSVVTFNGGHEFNSGVVRMTPDGLFPNIVLALDTLSFGDKKISFIKIDVEGHELSAFEGMVDLIKEHKPVIWAEDHSKRAIPFLQELGYNILEEELSTNDFLLACEKF